MPNFYLLFLQDIIRQFGLYCGVRHMRNKGVAFNHAYYAVFGRQPTR